MTLEMQNKLLVYFLSAVVAAGFAALYFRLSAMHFQQFSYKRLKFLSHRAPALVPLLLGIAFFAIPVTLRFLYSLVIPSIVLIAASFIIYKKLRHVKKPLVVTARVKRLIAVTFLLELCIIIVPSLFLKSLPRAFKLEVLAACATPFLLVAADILLIPEEKRINKKYTREAVHILRSQKRMKIVGITGSYGKTSVKEYLAAILDEKYRTLATPASYNTPLGVVRTVRESMRSTDEVFICEMGARNRGDIAELCDLVQPQVGIITAVGQQHLEYFKTQEAITATKYELAEAVLGGHLFLNWDNEIIRKNPPVNLAVTRYGTTPDCDVYAYDISVGSGLTFSVHTPELELTELHAAILGRHNVVNLTGAIAAAVHFGLSEKQIRVGLRRIKAPNHRLEVRPSVGTVTIIDDAYNSNPQGARSAVDALCETDGSHVIITPGMVELGERQTELNREFGTYAASKCDAVYVVGREGSATGGAVYDGAKQAGLPENRLFLFRNVTDAIDHARMLNLGIRHKYILLENDLPDNLM
ncbi:MAG: UDP-N-acetylmuramoyl-tripeptide--D-alanyl-D-alanine ligase [Oscillospiraceae bacterium]|jgi:UDP-N-acetylmuramoyl-tripeptide--D-alanyl-D-alanine ligase|nr:UDP-N-acetylmuramoyl-tripeptide--D-alanyl-D-alanine ligase [Oscillospiraceae bacterium]